jgi:hypothetical protein
MAITPDELQESLDDWAKEIKRDNSLLNLTLLEQSIEINKIKEELQAIRKYEQTLHNFLANKLGCKQ